MTRPRWGAPRSTSRGTTGAGRAARTVHDCPTCERYPFPPGTLASDWEDLRLAIHAAAVELGWYRLLDVLEDRHARRVHTYNASQKKGIQ